TSPEPASSRRYRRDSRPLGKPAASRSDARFRPPPKPEPPVAKPLHPPISPRLLRKAARPRQIPPAKPSGCPARLLSGFSALSNNPASPGQKPHGTAFAFPKNRKTP